MTIVTFIDKDILYYWICMDMTVSLNNVSLRHVLQMLS